MTTTSIIEFLENIQLECLKKRFGNVYEIEIKRLTDINSKLMPDFFTKKFKSFYDLSDNDLNELTDFAEKNLRVIKVISTKYSILAQDLILDFLFQRIYKHMLFLLTRDYYVTMIL